MNRKTENTVIRFTLSSILLITTLLSTGATETPPNASGTESANTGVPLGHADFLPTADRPIGYRGDGNGHFPGAMPPLTFSEKDGKNVRWSIKMPSWSQSSPIVVGKYVITAAEPDTTLCVDADTGKILWQDELGIYKKMVLDPNNPKENEKYGSLWSGNGYSWPCSDGKRIYKKWGGNVLVCYEVTSGKRLWLARFGLDWQKYGFTHEKPDKKVDGGFIAMYPGPQGYGSPLLYRDLVIYNNGTGLAALDKLTGELRWRSAPQVEGDNLSDNNFIVTRLGQRDVLVTNIGMLLDPVNGQTLGRAIPGVEKDGVWFSRLWGEMKSNSGKTPVSPVTGPDGLLAFGSAEGNACKIDTDQPWDQPYNPKPNNRFNVYLAVRVVLDGNGKPDSTTVFPNRALTPNIYGMNHITLLNKYLVVVPGYADCFSVIDLATGKPLFANRKVWNLPGKPKIDWEAPDTKAAMDEFGLNQNAIIATDRSLARDYNASYSRCFVDGRGVIWYMAREGSLYRIHPEKDFACEFAGTLDHPQVWSSFSSPYPHGNRIYVRTFGRLACIGEK